MNATTLAAWQEAFTAYLQNGSGEAALSAQISAQHIAAEVRLDVYRNAYYMRLEEALAHDFPALLAALGDHDFGRLMADYLRAYPSTSPTLRDLGYALPQWLHTQGKAEHADLAELEWAVLNAFDAADGRLLDQEKLAQLAPEDWAILSVRLHPSLTLLALNSNAADFWRARKAGSLQPTLASNAINWLAVVRSAQGPVLIGLTEIQHTVLERLHRGETVATVCAGLIGYAKPEEIPQIVAEILARAVASGWVCAMD
jgi:hypothetical protein